MDAFFDINNREQVSIIDDLPLWSAPFGLRLLDTIRLRPNLNVLDIGSGLGFPLLEVAQRLGRTCRAYGIDPWEGGVQRVNLKIKTLGLQNVTIIKGKAEQLPFDNGFFDLIISNNGINNVQDLERVLEECFRVCRSGAQMVVTVNLPDTMTEFYGVFKETLRAIDRGSYIEKVNEHIYLKRKPLEETSNALKKAGFNLRKIMEDRFTLRFLDGTAMLNHFLIKLSFLDSWKGILEQSEVPRILKLIEAELNRLSEEKGGLSLTVPFACLDCYK